jgi:pSer/pThr/pTyr-binding forkhead associated (FHA) protein
MTHILIRIGRRSDNDIVLSSSSISGYHAEIFVNEDGVVFLTDLNSTNGTYINGNRVHGHTLLKRGDILKLGIDKPLPWLNWVEQRQAEMSQPVANPLTNPEIQIGQTARRKSNFLETALAILIGLFVIVIIYLAVSFANKVKDKNYKEKDSTAVINSDLPVYEQDTQYVNSEADIEIPEQRSIRHNYDCIGNGWLTAGNDLKKELLAQEVKRVSKSTEIEYGNQLHESIKANYQIIRSGSNYNRLNSIFQNLIRNLPNGPKFNYQLFIINSDEVNAFTCGGRIYVTTAIINFCKNEHELACILGHEIYHNERGHLKEAIALSVIDGTGILSTITAAFDQKNELECDLHGVDLAISTRYEACAIVDFWRRMHNRYDTEGGGYDEFFRSHPYSDKRSECARDHISRNYNFGCK